MNEATIVPRQGEANIATVHNVAVRGIEVGFVSRVDAMVVVATLSSLDLVWDVFV